MRKYKEILSKHKENNQKISKKRIKIWTFKTNGVTSARNL